MQMKPDEFWSLTNREFLLLYWGSIYDQRQADYRLAWEVVHTSQVLRKGTKLLDLYKELQPGDNRVFGSILSEEEARGEYKEIWESVDESALSILEQKAGKKLELYRPESMT
jgi:hypothetical protein